MMLVVWLLAASLWQVDLDTPCDTKVQRLPEVRQGIMLSEAVLRDAYEIDARGREVIGVWTFMGIDPGDRIEFDTNVYLDGVPLALRSEHKPLSLDYDAWRWYPNYNIKTGPVARVEIHVVANVTGRNDVTPRAEGRDTARPHWGVWVLYRCGVPSSPGDVPSDDDGNPDEGGTPPSSEPRATDYIPWVERDAWALRVMFAYSEWRGDRDLGFLLARPEVVEAFGFDRAQLAADVDALFAYREERDTLAHRIANSKHRKFDDRSQVRKDVAEGYIKRATNDARAIYDKYGAEAARQGVVWGSGFDTWQGFINSPQGWTKWKAAR
jgi:hypothetical protein